MKAQTTEQAWSMTNEIFPTDYDIDRESSERAGYRIYRSTSDEHPYHYICDLGNRLELNMGAQTVNIWIEDTMPTEESSEDRSAMTQLTRLDMCDFGIACMSILFIAEGELNDERTTADRRKVLEGTVKKWQRLHAKCWQVIEAYDAKNGID